MATALNDISDAQGGYQSFFKESPCPMWILDPQTLDFLDVNDAAIRQYGYDRKEFEKLNLSDIRMAKDSEQVKQFILSRTDKDFFDAGISLHKRKNGEAFYVHVYAQSVLFEGKRMMLAMLIDQNEKVVVEHKNKELYEIIKTQKEQLDVMLASIDVVIWSKRTDTFQTAYVSSASEKVYGYKPNELIADVNIFSKLIHPSDKAIYIDAIKKVVETGSAEYELRALHRDSSMRYLKTSAVLVKGSDGAPDTITGFTHDVTEERKLQHKIKEDEYNLRSMIDNTEDFIWSVSKDMKYISINQAHKDFIKRLTGKAVKPGDSISTYDLESGDKNAWLEYYAQALKGEAYITVHETILNGVKGYFEARFNPIYDETNELVGISCFSRDITDRRSQLLKLEMQNERLKDIAWMQSHKIRNHVATILGLTQLLDHESVSAENEDLVQGIKNAAAALDASIKQINLLTKEVRIS